MVLIYFCLQEINLASNSTHMKPALRYLCYFFFISLLLTSCISQKKIEYLQDEVDSVATYSIPSDQEKKIKPNDELYINVSSFDDLSFNFFGTQGAISGMALTTDLSISLRTFSVDPAGKIFFPIIGLVDVLGLTTVEASIKLKELLASYFDQPIVTVKFGYKKITLLGEVNRPGYYTYSKDQLSILEAIGMAGDLTVHGNRKEIMLIRNTEGKAEKKIIDLTNDNLIFNTNYYLEPDDILYVKPRKSVKWATTYTPLTIIISSITTSVLILSTILDNTP